MRGLVRIDPDHHCRHGNSFLTGGQGPWPARPIPGLCGAHASFEPRHGEAPASWHVVRRPSPAGPAAPPARWPRCSPSTAVLRAPHVPQAMVPCTPSCPARLLQSRHHVSPCAVRNVGGAAQTVVSPGREALTSGALSSAGQVDESGARPASGRHCQPACQASLAHRTARVALLRGGDDWQRGRWPVLPSHCRGTARPSTHRPCLPANGLACPACEIQLAVREIQTHRVRRARRPARRPSALARRRPRSGPRP